MGLDPQYAFFRWAGGKRRLVRHLANAAPVDYRERLYIEPFFGAGSLFFALRPRKAVLSDLNEDLIETLMRIRERPGLVYRYLSAHASADGEKYYYKVRHQYNCATTYSSSQAARFIYLNRTCFNGIFRVNLKNEFNVPYGKLSRPQFPSRTHLESVGQTLLAAELKVADYREALKGASNGDFVYLDPPYPPLNGTSFFRHYTPERFDDADQAAVAGEARRLSEKGCLVMITNADTPRIRELYTGFNIISISATRSVSSKNRKHSVQELVITNY